VDLVLRGKTPLEKRWLQVKPTIEVGKAKADTYVTSKISHAAFFDDVFEAHARLTQVLDVVEGLLGPDLKLYQDQVFLKPPKVGSRQPYHQDVPLGFHIDRPDLVTCWAALDDATIENGCLWYIPGTHKREILDKKTWAAYEKQAVSGKLGEEVPVELKAGSCSFHHGLLLHASRPNLTDRSRRGYATHYVSAKCRYHPPIYGRTLEEEEMDAMLVRGQEYPGCR